MLPMTNKIEIFLSYADEDKEVVEKLESQLNALARSVPIDIWHKQRIPPGGKRASEINTHLNSAPVILVLLSSDYLASEELYREMERAMERHEAGEARVIPVLLRSVSWRGTPIGKLEPLPTNGQPVMSWHSSGRNDALFNIAQGVSTVVEQVIASQQAQPSTGDAVGKAQKNPVSAPVVRDQAVPGKGPGQQNTPSSGSATPSGQYDVFLSYAKADAPWVEDLAIRLEDEHHFQVWLDSWLLVPGTGWQQAIARGLDQAKAFAVCISAPNMDGWLQRQTDRALDRQTRDESLRVIPVLLPKAEDVNLYNFTFLGLNVGVNFRDDDFDLALHRLVSGIKGVSPGRGPRKKHP
jgi:hypothetical protein